ncbi:hypothetical protein AAH678_30350 [Sodalis endosymbiont of Spalangia cameroni]|uniref:hypothetical protein n=1 Tax=Sodalis praecaptivus TaxID=1239307 RepID=UPI0031FA2469
MIISQKIIKNETQQLKNLMMKDELEIPSFFNCVKPALFFVLWMILCPYGCFELAGQEVDETLTATGGGGFLGLLLSFGSVSGRSLYLSLPEKFRRSSKVLELFRLKVKIYIIAYAIMIFLFSLLGANSAIGSMAYLFPLVLGTLITVFIFNIDIGRYRLSAFTSVLELIKAHKQGGDE